MSEEVVIYHNPRCSKSRATLQILQDKGVEPRIVNYLDDPPAASEVARLIDLLGIEPEALLRKGEAEYAEAGLSAGADREAVSAAIARYPKLLERPVVVRGEHAVIGRPPERVLELL